MTNIDKLKNIYYDPTHPLGYTGNVKELEKIAPSAKTWLMQQPTYTLHRSVKRKFPTRAYRTSLPDNQWQADLVDMQGLKSMNKNYGYILTCIDIFTRFAWATPLKTKSYIHTINGFENIFSKGRKPTLLQTDQGKEFENKNIQLFFTKNGIKQFSVKSPYKAAIVERFHRTLRGRMVRYFTKNGTRKWIDILDDIVAGYNAAKHKALFNASPDSINSENAMQLWEARNSDTVITEKSVFKVGDFVRLALVRKTFERGYTPNWTEELFRISKIDRTSSPIMYIVVDDDNDEIDGKFYRQELQKVDNVHRIEKILKTKQQRNGLKYYIKWVGGDKPSWIDSTDLI